MGNGLMQVSAFDKLLSIGDYEEAYDNGDLRYVSYLNTGLLTFIGADILSTVTQLERLDMPNVKVINGMLTNYGTKLSIISAPKLTKLSPNNFIYCSMVEELYLPNVETIDDAIWSRNRYITPFYNSTYYKCSLLKKITLPKCYSIPDYIFQELNNLEYLSIPECTSLYNSVFAGCSKLKTLTLNKVSYMSHVNFIDTDISEIYLPAFSYIDRTNFNIQIKTGTSVYLKNVSYISKNYSEYSEYVIPVNGDVYLNNCLNIFDNVRFRDATKVYLPRCSSIPSRCFYLNNYLTYANLSTVKIIGESTFYSCSNLESINIERCEEIKSTAFYKCYKIQELNVPYCKSFTFKSNIIGSIYYSYNSSYYNGYGTYIFNQLSELYIDTYLIDVTLGTPYRNTCKKIIFNGKKIIFNDLEGYITGIENFICSKCETINIIPYGTGAGYGNLISITNTCRWSFPKLKNINNGKLLCDGNTFMLSGIPQWLLYPSLFELIPSSYMNDFIIDFPMLEMANLFIYGNRFMDYSYYQIYSMTVNIPNFSNGFLGLVNYITSPSINNKLNLPLNMNCLFINQCNLYSLYLKSINGLIIYGSSNIIYNLKLDATELTSFVAPSNYYPGELDSEFRFSGFNFWSLSSLYNIELPYCSLLDIYIFSKRIGTNYYNDTYFSAPELTYIKAYWFTTVVSYFMYFENIYMPKLSSINSVIQMHFNCKNVTIGLYNDGEGSQIQFNDMIENLSASNLISINNSTTIGHRYLKTLYIPNCEYIGSYVLGSSLTTIANNSTLSILDLPKCSYINHHALNTLRSLQYLCVPELLYLGSYTLFHCSYLTYLDFPKCSFIGDNALPSTIELVKFGYSGIVSLGTVNMNLSYTHIIQVPESLYSAYMSDSRYISLMSQGNWLLTAY